MKILTVTDPKTKRSMDLSGEELEDYCKSHGLCSRCAKTKTHKRVVKLFGKTSKWEPLTLPREDDHHVYEGYCMDCYTMGEVKRLLGESTTRSRRVLRSRSNILKKPGKRKTKTNPETGSVLDGNASIASNTSSVHTTQTRHSILSGISGLSGFSGFSRQNRKKPPKRSSSSLSSRFDDEITVDSLLASDGSPTSSLRSEPSQPILPLVNHKIDQLVSYDYFTVLHLQGIDLGSSKNTNTTDALVKAVAKARTLQTVHLENCSLGDDGIEKLAGSLEARGHFQSKGIEILRLRGNKIGNRGVQALEFLFQGSSCLREIDLSDNNIGSKGAISLFGGLKMNRNRIPLKILNLSQNEIWELSQTPDENHFLKSNTTLEELNLDGNFLHDGGAEFLAKCLSHGVLQTLYLGWNGIGDDGIKALSNAIESNKTLKVLGLAENEITNTGARALLSALAINATIQEISGLYHNKIDRKFIIVAIKRLLHRPSEDNKGFDEDDKTSPTVVDDSENSSNDLPHIDTLTAPLTHNTNGSLALEAIENWDWGTFGIDEIETAQRTSELCDPSEASENGETSNLYDKMVLFQAAPLAYFDRKTMQHHGVPLLDFEREADGLRESLPETIDVMVETATQNNFHNVFAKSSHPLVHFSSYGNGDCITLENGFGYMQALPQDSLRKMVSGSHVQVVVISSCHAHYLAEAFLAAGVPHVVAIERKASFHERGSIGFFRGFYKALARKSTLQEAFDEGLLTCEQTTVCKILPEGKSHDVKVFFQNPSAMAPSTRVPPSKEFLPSVPDSFVGREVDMYEILESLRVDDVVRIGGPPGSGKKSILAVLSRYILDRSNSFQIDSVYWLPSIVTATPDPDSLYGDLCQTMEWIIAAEDDIWDEEHYTDARERILIEMEGQNSILIIDGRDFTNEIAGEMLERFLTFLLNEVNVKIVLITATDASRGKTNRSRSEETMVHLGPLDFVSTVRLFGSACPLIATSPVVDTLSEFERLLVPSDRTESTEDASHRQQGLYEIMGKGNPSEILDRAKTCSVDDFLKLLRIAQRPQIRVSSSKELAEERNRWEEQKNHALEKKYYFRALEIDKTLQELDELRKIYPSLEDLKSKEIELRKKFTALLKAKRYDDANFVKRKLLTLKRSMVKERASGSSLNASHASAASKIHEIQERMKVMMAMADSLGQSTSSIGGISLGADSAETNDKGSAVFRLSEDCSLHISPGSIHFPPPTNEEGVSSVVVWTNEAFDISAWKKELSRSTQDKSKIQLLVDAMSALNPLRETEWGPVKCVTGDSKLMVALDIDKAGGVFNLVFAVPPLPIAKDAKKHEIDCTVAQLRSAVRSSFRSIVKSGKATNKISISTDIPLFDAQTNPDDDNQGYLGVFLKTIVEETRSSFHRQGSLQAVEIVASSGVEESNKLIGLASEELGLESIA